MGLGDLPHGVDGVDVGREDMLGLGLPGGVADEGADGLAGSCDSVDLGSPGGVVAGGDNHLERVHLAVGGVVDGVDSGDHHRGGVDVADLVGADVEGVVDIGGEAVDGHILLGDGGLLGSVEFGIGHGAFGVDVLPLGLMATGHPAGLGRGLGDVLDGEILDVLAFIAELDYRTVCHSRAIGYHSRCADAILGIIIIGVDCLIASARRYFIVGTIRTIVSKTSVVDNHHKVATFVFILIREVYLIPTLLHIHTTTVYKHCISIDSFVVIIIAKRALAGGLQIDIDTGLGTAGSASEIKTHRSIFSVLQFVCINYKLTQSILIVVVNGIAATRVAVFITNHKAGAQGRSLAGGGEVVGLGGAAIITVDGDDADGVASHLAEAVDHGVHVVDKDIGEVVGISSLLHGEEPLGLDGVDATLPGDLGVVVTQRHGVDAGYLRHIDAGGLLHADAVAVFAVVVGADIDAVGGLVVEAGEDSHVGVDNFPFVDDDGVVVFGLHDGDLPLLLDGVLGLVALPGGSDLVAVDRSVGAEHSGHGDAGGGLYADAVAIDAVVVGAHIDAVLGLVVEAGEGDAVGVDILPAEGHGVGGGLHDGDLPSGLVGKVGGVALPGGGHGVAVGRSLGVDHGGHLLAGGEAEAFAPRSGVVVAVEHAHVAHIDVVGLLVGKVFELHKVGIDTFDDGAAIAEEAVGVEGDGVEYVAEVGGLGAAGALPHHEGAVLAVDAGDDVFGHAAVGRGLEAHAGPCGGVAGGGATDGAHIGIVGGVGGDAGGYVHRLFSGEVDGGDAGEVADGAVAQHELVAFDVAVGVSPAEGGGVVVDVADLDGVDGGAHIRIANTTSLQTHHRTIRTRQ